MNNGCSKNVNSPRVSVITPFLNGEAFLAEAIESVIAQTFSNWELLLVDDGSEPAATVIAKSYAAQYRGRIRYFEHPGHVNRGVCAARNLGLSHAQGNCVAFLDADDVWMPSKLADQVAVLDGHPNLGMVCGAAIYWSSWSGGNDVIHPSGHRQDLIVYPPETSLALYPLGSATPPCPSDIMLPTDYARALGGFEEQFTGQNAQNQLYEDQAFLAKVYLAAPVYFSSKIWLKYRQHADSCVGRVNAAAKYHDIRLYFLNWFEAYLNNRPNSDRLVLAALARALRPYRKPRVHYLLTLPSKLRRKLRNRYRGLRNLIGEISQWPRRGRDQPQSKNYVSHISGSESH
jgi:glycosyltransferase involved in cell wall biosynthesis